MKAEVLRENNFNRLKRSIIKNENQGTLRISGGLKGVKKLCFHLNN